ASLNDRFSLEQIKFLFGLRLGVFVVNVNNKHVFGLGFVGDGADVFGEILDFHQVLEVLVHAILVIEIQGEGGKEGDQGQARNGGEEAAPSQVPGQGLGLGLRAIGGLDGTL